MRWENTPEDEATRQAMMKALAMVFVPAAIAIFALLYVVVPRRPPTSQAWANGTYINPCCPPILLRDGLLASGKIKSKYRVDYGKRGYFIHLDEGIGVDGKSVKLGALAQNVPFNRVSEAQPAIHEPESLHLYQAKNFDDVIFVKQ